MKYTLVAAFFVFFGCVGVAAGVSIFLPGFNDDRAFVLVIVTPLFFGVAGIAIVTRLRMRSRRTTSVHSILMPDGSGQALVIPYSLTLAVIYWVIGVTTIFLFIIIALVAVVGLASTGFRDAALFVPALVSMAFVVYLSWFLIEVLRRRVARGALILSPRGIYHRSWSFDNFLPWDSAISVTAGELDGPLIRVAAREDAESQFQRRTRMWKQPELKLAPHMAIRGTYLSINPALVLHALSYYLNQPSARPELGTEAGVNRVCNGNVAGLH
ncbi:MAG: hypothetical protein WCC38_07890 [Pseudonocardiaceae bacterium]